MRLIFGIVFAVMLAANSVAGAASPEGAPTGVGAALYEQYCRTCHGVDRTGYAADNAPSLVSPTFLETADDTFLHSAIERGRAGTAMGGYGKLFGGPLEAAEINDIIKYLRGDTKLMPLPAEASSGNVVEGQRVYRSHCETCHGTSAQRGSAVHLANPMFLETASDAFLRAAIVRGRPGTPMVAWQTQLAPQEIEDVVAYIRALARMVPPPAPQELLSLDDVPIVINPDGEPANLTIRDALYVSVEDVAKAYKEKKRLVIIDARTPSDFLRLHITGAISIPYFNMRDLDKVPNDGTWVVAYCACPHHVSGIVVGELRKRGYANTAVLDEGIFTWQLKGNPTTVAPGQLPIPAPPAASTPQPPQDPTTTK